MIKLVKSGKKISPADIDDLARQIGFELPKDYASFLAKTNGGAFEDYMYIAIPQGQVTSVDVIYGVGPSAIRDGMKMLEEFEYGMPQGYWPVASDAGSNKFLLCLLDEERGIYYWDWQSLFRTTSEEMNTYFVAS